VLRANKEHWREEDSKVVEKLNPPLETT
jgi:hypothetical protein